MSLLSDISPAHLEFPRRLGSRPNALLARRGRPQGACRGGVGACRSGIGNTRRRPVGPAGGREAPLASATLLPGDRSGASARPVACPSSRGHGSALRAADARAAETSVHPATLSGRSGAGPSGSGARQAPRSGATRRALRRNRVQVCLEPEFLGRRSARGARSTAHPCGRPSPFSGSLGCRDARERCVLCQPG
jgi:hypothetical protein